MVLVKRNKKKCPVCGQFAGSWVICETCRKMVCVECAGSNEACMEHYVIRQKDRLLSDYFSEKYGRGVCL